MLLAREYAFTGERITAERAVLATIDFAFASEFESFNDDEMQAKVARLTAK